MTWFAVICNGKSLTLCFPKLVIDFALHWRLASFASDPYLDVDINLVSPRWHNLIVFQQKRVESLIQGYYIKWRGPSSPERNWVNVTNPAASSYTVGGLLPYTTYAFFVIPYHKTVEGVPSNSQDGTTDEARTPFLFFSQSISKNSRRLVIFAAPKSCSHVVYWFCYGLSANMIDAFVASFCHALKWKMFLTWSSFDREFTVVFTLSLSGFLMRLCEHRRYARLRGLFVRVNYIELKISILFSRRCIIVYKIQTIPQ